MAVTATFAKPSTALRALRNVCPTKRRSPGGITAEAGEPYLGHTRVSVARLGAPEYAMKPEQAKRWITDSRLDHPQIETVAETVETTAEDLAPALATG